jgi:hypothetical protein
LQVCPHVETQSGPSQQSASTARRFILHASPPTPAASSMGAGQVRVSTRVRAEGKARATMMAPADAPGCKAHFVLFQRILAASAQVGHLRAVCSQRCAVAAPRSCRDPWTP